MEMSYTERQKAIEDLAKGIAAQIGELQKRDFKVAQLIVDVLKLLKMQRDQDNSMSHLI